MANKYNVFNLVGNNGSVLGVGTNSGALPFNLPSPSEFAQKLMNMNSSSSTNSNDADLLIEYIRLSNSISNVAQNQRASTSLSTSLSILLSLMIFASAFGNVTLFMTIMCSKMFRRNRLYLLLCELAVMNLLEVIFVMIFSVVGISLGFWALGDVLCSVNTFFQEFISQKILFTLMLMAIERVIGFVRPHLITCRRLASLEVLFILIPVLFATPTLLPQFPVEFYPYRYLCDIGIGSPIAYSIAKIIVYCGCLFVLLVCFGSLLRHKTTDRSLPVNQQDYRAFIIESRAMEEHLRLGRLVLVLTLTFLVLEGPFICLDFFVDIRNSEELLTVYDDDFDFPQIPEILIIWLKFFHPLISPIIILFWCPDIWFKWGRLLCRCQNRAENNPNSEQQIRPTSRENNENVLTLFATENGLELRVPQLPQYGVPQHHRRNLPLTLAPVEKSVASEGQVIWHQKRLSNDSSEPPSDESSESGSSFRPLVTTTRFRHNRNAVSDIEDIEEESIKPVEPVKRISHGGNGFAFKAKKIKNRNNNNKKMLEVNNAPPSQIPRWKH